MKTITKTIPIVVSMYAFTSAFSLAGDMAECAALLGDHVLQAGELPSHGTEIGMESSSADASFLMSWVLKICKEDAMERLGIAVSDEEANSAVGKMVGDGQSFMQKNNLLLMRLPQALRLAKANPEQVDEIYQTHLEGLMSRGLWQLHLAKNYTEEELSKMENHNPMTEDELGKIANTIRPALMERKLRDAICGTANEREECWIDWCRQQVLSADVVIPDEKLRSEFEKRRGSLEKTDKQHTVTTPPAVSADSEIM